jgi:hypothetical protein
MAVIYDEQDINVLDELGAQVMDEAGSTGGPPIKNPTSWVPQPMGFGYVSGGGSAVPLTTQAGLMLTTNLGVLLTTWVVSISGKYPTTWEGTGA